jgi:hypothetical protein
MSAGEAAHHRHGTQVRASVLLARLAYLLLTLAVLIAVVLLMRGGGG